MRIKPEVCAYVRSTPYMTDFTLRNMACHLKLKSGLFEETIKKEYCDLSNVLYKRWNNPFQPVAERLSGEKRYFNNKMRLPVFDPKTGELVRKEENIRRSLRRARKTLVEYALCNDFEFFGTITIDPEKWDVSRPDIIQKEVSAAFHSYEVMHPDFKYIYVPEYGEKTHRLHFHFLAIGLETFINEHNYLDCHLLRDKFGFCNINRIGDKEEDKIYTSLYCTKYITKQGVRISKRYFYNSHNLKKPETMTLHSIVALKMYDELKKMNANEFFESRYCKCIGCRTSVWKKVFDEYSYYIDIWRAHRVPLYLKRPLAKYGFWWHIKEIRPLPDEEKRIFDSNHPIQISFLS